MNWIREYLQEVMSEMRKVNWPDRQELISNTFITIVATLLISAFIYGADQIISGALTVLYQ
jgi:preprotein translocase subunit SecE